MRGRGVRRAERGSGPRPVGLPQLRSRGGHRRPLPLARSTPGTRHPARAGRQQPHRDRGRLRARRFHRARCAHERPARRRSLARRIQGPGGLRGLFLRRCAGRGRGLGQIDPVPPAGARGVRALLRTSRQLRARHLQRLPDVRRAQAHHPGHGALAALRAQPQRAVRGTLLAGRGAALPVGAAAGHGGLDPAHCGGARGGAGRVRVKRRRRGLRGERPGGVSLPQQRRQPRERLSRQSQRHALRHRGAVEP